VIDHLCRVRCCVNPDHLEPVTTQENIRRGEVSLVSKSRAASRKHCPRGHFYSEKNTLTKGRKYRTCRECKRLASGRYRSLKAFAVNH
jgi:HNH endonuclease